jgi:hypothetical protein
MDRDLIYNARAEIPNADSEGDDTSFVASENANKRAFWCPTLNQIDLHLACHKGRIILPLSIHPEA